MVCTSSKSMMLVCSLSSWSNTLKELVDEGCAPVIFWSLLCCTCWVFPGVCSSSTNISYFVSADKISSIGIFSNTEPSISLMSMSLSLIEMVLGVWVSADTVCFSIFTLSGCSGVAVSCWGETVFFCRPNSAASAAAKSTCLLGEVLNKGSPKFPPGTKSSICLEFDTVSCTATRICSWVFSSMSFGSEKAYV